MDIKQAANRLENASTSSERIAALQHLQSLAKQNCSAVGGAVLQFVLDVLKENGESDEYVEALELISKLVKPKNGEAAVQNAQIVIRDVMNVELLLDLLEHEDGLVGVMSSEILTNIHAIAAEELESTIQDCPAGLTKLLNRMPDRSREEVSNQAIILIRQLTSSNEEMKKTVAFNEGFETIFGVIESEGGYKEANAVVQDCLEICCNVLDGSEICQRLFYGMGGGWHFKLLEFFSPVTMEALSRKPPGASITAQDGDDEDRDSTFIDFAQHGPWFEQTGRLRCAILSSHCLEASMGPTGDHHVAVSSAAEHIIASCAHWIVRSGPAEMLPACFSIINSLATGPERHSFALRMFSTILRYSPSASGLNIPTVLSTGHIHFSWKLPGADERRAIAVPNLFAERYLFPVHCWWGHESSTRTTRVNSQKDKQGMVYLVGNEFWMGALHILESMLAADENTSGMLVQNILAPPPPPMEPDEYGMTGHTDSMQMEFGSLVLSILLNSLDRIIVYQGGSSGGAQQSIQADASLAIRAANIMTLVLVHGGLLARELSTAVCTVHLATQRTALDASFKAQNLTAGASSPILPYLLSFCSRVVRVPGVGFTVACAVLRLLTAAACNCERSSTQMLDDPANFFVVDLASRNSESAGVPEGMQTACCLFLGACFDSFPRHVHSSDTSQSESGVAANRLSRSSILCMVDSKIGLSRFSDLLKRPVTKSSRTTSQDYYNPEDLYFCDSFKKFYLKQIESIRTAIFDFYSGSSVSGGVTAADSPEGQVIKMQKETIAQLEDELRQYQQSSQVTQRTAVGVPAAADGVPPADEYVEALRVEMAQLNQDLSSAKAKCTQLEEAYREESGLVKNMAKTETALVNEVEDLRTRLEDAQRSANTAQEQMVEQSRKLQLQSQAAPEHMQEKLTALLAENEQLRREVEECRVGSGHASNGSTDGHADEEILKLKEKIVNLSSAKKSLNEEVDTLNRKLVMLEEDLLTPMPYDKVNTSKIADLEARNASLRTDIWEMESNMASMKSAMDSELSVLRATIATLVDLSEVGENDCLMPSSEYNEGATLPQLLSRKVEACVEILQFAAGRCSDIGEGIGLRYDTLESKAMQRCIEVVDKACARVHDAEIKIQEGESIRHHLDATQAELLTLQEIHDSVSSKLDAMELECEQLRSSSEISEGNVSQEKAAALFDRIASLQTSLTEKEAKVAELMSSLKRSSEQHQSDASRITTLNEVIENISSKMESMQQMASGGDSSRELSILQVELKEALDENMDLAEKITNYEQALRQAAEALESKTRERDEVLAELESLRKQRDDSEKGRLDEATDLEELRRTMLEQGLVHEETIDALRAKLDCAVTEADSMASALHATENERDSLKQQLTESLEHGSELEMTNRQTVDLLQTHYRLVTEKSSKLLEYEEALRRGEEKDGEGLEAMVDQLMKLEIQLKGVEGENVELQARFVTNRTELDNAREALDEKTRDYECLVTELEELQLEQAAASNRLTEVTELGVKSNEEFASLHMEKNKLTEKLVELEESMRQLESENIDLQGRLNAVDEAACAHLTQLKLVIKEKETLADELARYKDELQDVRVLASGYDVAIEAREAEVELMKTEIKSAKDEMDQLKDKLSDKDNKVSELSKVAEQKDAECVQLRSALEGKATELGKVLEKYLKLKEQVGSTSSAGANAAHLQADCTRLTQEMSELRRKLQKSEDSREQLVETANAQAGKIAGYDQIIDGLEADIEGLTEAKEATEEACKAIVADLEKKIELLSCKFDSEKGISNACSAELKSLRATFEDQVIAEMNQQSARMDSAMERASARLAYVQRGIVLVSAAICQQKKVLGAKERDTAEESRLEASEQRHVDEAAVSSMTPLSKSSVVKYTTSPVTSAIGATPNQVRDNARLQAEIRKERQRLHSLQEQHTDLLGLLAQQEIELQVFRDNLLSCGGARVYEDAEMESRRVVTERYGSYIAFRNAEEQAVVI